MGLQDGGRHAQHVMQLLLYVHDYGKTCLCLHLMATVHCSGGLHVLLIQS